MGEACGQIGRGRVGHGDDLAAAPAAAQIDWDADNYGVFFDQAGTQTSLHTPPGPVTVYMVLLNPTVDAAEITGWEAGCWRVREIGADHHFPVGPAMPLTFTPAGGGIILPGDCPTGGAWAGGGPQVLIAGSAVVLGTFETVVVDMKPYGFYADWGGGVLGREGGPDIVLTTSTSALSSMPPLMWLSATINSDFVPVPDDDLEWGTVKALYR